MITRRRFIQAIAALPLLSRRAAASAKPSVAITMDDFNWKLIPEPYAKGANSRLLAHLKGHQIALFVRGDNVDGADGQRLLQTWDSAGHLICNHTYSHRLLDSLGVEKFEADMLRCEPLISRCRHFTRLFRFPALKEGKTAEVRDAMRVFLKAHNYRNGCVTIDASDWYYDARLRQRLAAEPSFDVQQYRQPYLDHIRGRAEYYESLSRDVLGRSIPHTLLIHYNLLNTLFLGDLLAMFRATGWTITSASHAFADPVFQRQPNTAPAGESLLWALAKESGRYEGRLRYPGEDDVYEKPLLDRLGL